MSGSQDAKMKIRNKSKSRGKNQSKKINYDLCYTESSQK